MKLRSMRFTSKYPTIYLRYPDGRILNKHECIHFCFIFRLKHSATRYNMYSNKHNSNYVNATFIYLSFERLHAAAKGLMSTYRRTIALLPGKPDGHYCKWALSIRPYIRICICIKSINTNIYNTYTQTNACTGSNMVR